MRRHRQWPIVVAIIVLMVASGSVAQGAEPGKAELSGYAGVTMGAIGAHPAAGASAGISLSRHASFLADLSYMPLGGNTLQFYPGQVRVANSGLYDLNLTGNILIPLHRGWEPYLIGGLAFLFSTYRVATGNAQGSVIFANRSDSDVGFETGAGVRYFLAENWGVRTEYRYTFSNRNFGRFLAGFFYQFDGEGFRLRRGRTHHTRNN